MAKLPIITLPDPALRKVSAPVERVDDAVGDHEVLRAWIELEQRGEIGARPTPNEDLCPRGFARGEVEARGEGVGRE